MKTILTYILIIAFTGSLTACSSLKVVSDVDPEVDFTMFKTYEYYGWAEDSDKILNRLDKERIERAFSNELQERGLKHVEKDVGADLIVTLFIVTDQKTRTTATTTGIGGGPYGYGYGYGGWGPGFGWGGVAVGHTTFHEYDYTVGTLVIAVYDATGEKLIWEAAGTATINENTKGRDKRVQEAAEKIMASYPVEAVQ